MHFTQHIASLILGEPDDYRVQTGGTRPSSRLETVSRFVIGVCEALHLKRSPLNLRVTSMCLPSDSSPADKEPGPSDWALVSASESQASITGWVKAPSTKPGFRVRFDLGDGEITYPESVLNRNPNVDDLNNLVDYLTGDNPSYRPTTSYSSPSKDYCLPSDFHSYSLWDAIEDAYYTEYRSDSVYY